MNTKRTCVIFNPKAGTAAKVDQVREELARLPGVSLQETRAPGDGSRIARSALNEGFPRIIVMGGDGTVNEVLNGIAPDFNQVELGIAPLGTGNDFATLVQIPPEPEEAIECLLSGKTAMIDVAVLESPGLRRYFLNASAGGFSTKVTEHLNSERKEFWGALAFYISAAEAIPDLETYRMKVLIDESDAFEVEALNLVVANGRAVAGGIPIAPVAEPDDGLLDLLILPTMPVAELASLFQQFLGGEPANDQLVRQARQIEISCDPAMRINVDGEMATDTPVRYSVMPQALRMLVSPEWVRIRAQAAKALAAKVRAL
ncbi:MAG: diacylglycerol kinase family protein [Bryobacterales bacterium]